MALLLIMFYVAIDVAASKINNKIHQLFSKQQILGVRVTIAQRKI